MPIEPSVGDDNSSIHKRGVRVRSITPPTSNAFEGGIDEVDTSFDVSSDIILPNDSDDIITKGVKGDRRSGGSRAISSNVSFYPDGTSSPQQKRLVPRAHIFYA